MSLSARYALMHERFFTFSHSSPPSLCKSIPEILAYLVPLHRLRRVNVAIKVTPGPYTGHYVLTEAL